MKEVNVKGKWELKHYRIEDQFRERMQLTFYPNDKEIYTTATLDFSPKYFTTGPYREKLIFDSVCQLYDQLIQQYLKDYGEPETEYIFNDPDYSSLLKNANVV